MIVKVHMLAFMEGEVREVNVPDSELPVEYRIDTLLDKVFHYGQNDFQPVANRCSVSMGDVVELGCQLWLVAPLGFREITREKFDELKRTPRRDRFLLVYDRDE